MRSIPFFFALLASLVCADGRNPISAPKAGSVVVAGTSYVIRWSATTPGPVSISLQDDASTVNISTSTPNTGSYSWNPSTSLIGKTNYFLHICDLTLQSECTYTFDGRFAISSDVSSSIFAVTTSSASSTRRSTSTSASSTSSATTTSTPIDTFKTTSSPSSSATNVSDEPVQQSSSSLSTAAKIGIAAVLAVVGTAAIGIGAFFWYRRRQRIVQSHGTVELPEKQVYTHEAYAGHGRSELEHQSHPVELDHRNRPISELPDRQY